MTDQKPPVPEWLDGVIGAPSWATEDGCDAWEKNAVAACILASLERDREERRPVRPWADELDAVSFAEWFDKESGGVFDQSLNGYQLSTLYRMFYQAYEGKAPE